MVQPPRNRRRPEPAEIAAESKAYIYKMVFSYCVMAFHVIYVMALCSELTRPFAQMFTSMHYFKRVRGVFLFQWGVMDLLPFIWASANCTVMWLWMSEIIDYMTKDHAQLEALVKKSYIVIKTFWYVISSLAIVYLMLTLNLTTTTLWNDSQEGVRTSCKFFILAQASFFMSDMLASPSLRLRDIRAHVRLTEGLGYLVLLFSSVTWGFVNLTMAVLFVRYMIELIRLTAVLNGHSYSFEDEEEEVESIITFYNFFTVAYVLETVLNICMALLLLGVYNNTHSNLSCILYALYVHAPTKLGHAIFHLSPPYYVVPYV